LRRRRNLFSLFFFFPSPNQPACIWHWSRFYVGLWLLERNGGEFQANAPRGWIMKENERKKKTWGGVENSFFFFFFFIQPHLPETFPTHCVQVTKAQHKTMINIKCTLIKQRKKKKKKFTWGGGKVFFSFFLFFFFFFFPYLIYFISARGICLKLSPMYSSDQSPT